MQLLLRVCSVDRVRTIQCRRRGFGTQVHLTSIAAPQIQVQISMYLIACVTVGVELILQNIPNKVVHFIIHTEFSSD